MCLASGMTRTRLLCVVLGVLVLVASACGDSTDSSGDGTTSSAAPSTPTTVAPTTTASMSSSSSTTSEPAPATDDGAWSVLLVDEKAGATDGLVGLDLATLSDGRPRVFYGQGSSLRMATCVDVACMAVDVVEITDIAPWVAGELWLSAALRGDGSPVVVLAQRGETVFLGDQPEEIALFDHRLVWCEDPDCDSVVSTVLPYGVYGEPMVAASPDGRVGVVDLFNVSPLLLGGVHPDPFIDPVIGFTYCERPTCLDDPSQLTELTRYSPILQRGPTRPPTALFGPDGNLVVVYTTSPFGASADDTSLYVLRCVDADCMTVGEPQLVATGGPEGLGLTRPDITDDGSLMLTYEVFPPEGDANPGSKLIVSICDGLDCTSATSTVMAQAQTDPFCCIASTLASDGRPVAVVSNRLGGLRVTQCTDPACSEVSDPVLLPFRSLKLAATTANDGAIIIVTADTRSGTAGIRLHRCGTGTCAPS